VDVIRLVAFDEATYRVYQERLNPEEARRGPASA
jgi:hypothetical protein